MIVNGRERSPLFGTIRCPLFGTLRDSHLGGYPVAALPSSSFAGALSMPALLVGGHAVDSPGVAAQRVDRGVVRSLRTRRAVDRRRFHQRAGPVGRRPDGQDRPRVGGPRASGNVGRQSGGVFRRRSPGAVWRRPERSVARRGERQGLAEVAGALSRHRSGFFARWQMGADG